MTLFQYFDTATMRNQHQLLMCKTSKWQSLLFKKIFFRIIIQHLTKCNILSTFALKNYRKFFEHNLEKLCPQSLTSIVSFFGLERVCLRKVSVWPRIFLNPWPRRLCNSTPPLVKSNAVLSTVRHHCDISSKGAVLPGRNDAEMGPPTHYMLWHNAASIMKGLI